MADFKETFAPPVPTVVDGQRAVTDIVGNRVKLDVSDDIFQYDPNASALTLLTTKLRKKRKVSQYIYHWLEKERYNRFTTLSVGVDANDTTITAADASLAAKNYLVRNMASGEVFYVSANDGTNWTVTRFDDARGPQNAGDKLEILGTAFEEGARLGTDKSVKERLVSNKCQTIRTSYAFTGRDENTDMYGGKDPMVERKWQAVEHAISVEKNMWFSTESEFTGPDGKKVTTMDGVHQFVQDNVWDLNGMTFTYRALVEYMEYAMRYGRGGRLGTRQKFLFCAPRFLTEFSSWGSQYLEIPNKAETFGLDITRIITPHGKVNAVPHPLFEEQGDIAYLLDLNHIRYVFHQGRDTHLLKSREENDRDGSREELISDVSIMVELSKAHGFIRNLAL